MKTKMIEESTEEVRTRLVRELKGTVCFCGAKKRDMNTFCNKHYYALPPAKRQALYTGIFNGYVDAYLDARKFLEGEGNALSQNNLG